MFMDEHWKFGEAIDDGHIPTIYLDPTAYPTAVCGWTTISIGGWVNRRTVKNPRKGEHTEMKSCHGWRWCLAITGLIFSTSFVCIYIYIYIYNTYFIFIWFYLFCSYMHVHSHFGSKLLCFLFEVNNIITKRCQGPSSLNWLKSRDPWPWDLDHGSFAAAIWFCIYPLDPSGSD